MKSNKLNRVKLDMKLNAFQIASISTALGVSLFITQSAHAVTLAPTVHKDTLKEKEKGWRCLKNQLNPLKSKSDELETPETRFL